MNARSPELVQNILASKELGKTFAEDAVRELSRLDPDPNVWGRGVVTTPAGHSWAS